MEKFEDKTGITGTVSGVFPDTIPLDDTGPSATDGTPNLAITAKEFWGAMQAIINAAGITPSGTPDVDGASDLLDAINYLVANPTLDLNARTLAQELTLKNTAGASAFIGAEAGPSGMHLILKTSNNGGTIFQRRLVGVTVSGRPSLWESYNCSYDSGFWTADDISIDAFLMETTGTASGGLTHTIYAKYATLGGSWSSWDSQGVRNLTGSASGAASPMQHETEYTGPVTVTVPYEIGFSNFTTSTGQSSVSVGGGVDFNCRIIGASSGDVTVTPIANSGMGNTPIVSGISDYGCSLTTTTTAATNSLQRAYQRGTVTYKRALPA